MKKIEFYVTKNEIKQIDEYFKNFSNSLIDYKENKFYFNSKIYNSKEEIEIKVRIVNFSKELVHKLEEILRLSRIKALEISDEPIEEFLDDSVYSEINTTVNKFNYEECKSIFYFVAELFYKYLMGHHLKNGNKRLSLMFLINSLWFFGYYFKWTKGKKNYKYKEYKSKLEEWVEKFQNSNKTKNDTIKNIILIEKWIKKNVVIALNWR